MARRFKRPKNGHFSRYCGECAHWTACDDERLKGLGRCEYVDEPTRPVSLAYYIADVCTDQYEGACQLFEVMR